VGFYQSWANHRQGSVIGAFAGIFSVVIAKKENHQADSVGAHLPATWGDVA
jgi:hypothetical protein